MKSMSACSLNDVTTPILIIVPCYNESEAIRGVVKRIKNVLNNTNYRVLIIDDGSTDDSYNILLGENYEKNIQVLKNKKNCGKGFTIRHGFSKAKSNELVIIIDGDGEHHPEDIPDFILPLVNKDAEVVVGSRFMKIPGDLCGNKGSYLNNLKRFSHIRKFGNWLFSVLIFFFYNRFLTDTQCGFRAFAPGVLRNIDLVSNGFQIETEISVKTLKKGWRIKEVPIHNGQSTRSSHMKMIEDSLKIIAIIFELSFTPKFRKWTRNMLRKLYII